MSMSSESESEEVESIMKKQVIIDTEKESGMLNSEDLTEEEKEILKGDIVGDTSYSGSWIIHTLLLLSKINESGFTDLLERHMCMLWDMTTKPDVVNYLIENDFLRIAEHILKTNTEPRVTEITVGIIGNMCCQLDVFEAVATNRELVDVILDLTLSDDPETLIQVFRLLQTTVWDIMRNQESPWLENLKGCNFFANAVIFILKSSTNGDLLIVTTDLLQSISAVELPEHGNLLSELFNIADLIPALSECFTQLISNDNERHSQSELKIIENWLALLSSIIQLELLEFTDGEEDSNFIKIMDILQDILRPYVHSCNLIPIHELLALCIHESVSVIAQFQRNEMQMMPQIIGTIVTIMFRLNSAISGEYSNGFEINSDDIPEDLLKYLERYWILTLGLCNEAQIKDILLTCGDDVVKYLIEVTESNPSVSNEQFKELTRVASLIQDNVR